MTLVQGQAWVMDNNCVKYYPDRKKLEVMARTQHEEMDRQTDRQGDSLVYYYIHLPYMEPILNKSARKFKIIVSVGPI